MTEPKIVWVQVRSVDDDELDTIQLIQFALSSLDSDAKLRCLNYCTNRAIASSSRMSAAAECNEQPNAMSSRMHMAASL